MKQYTPEELNKLSKEEIVALLMQSQKEAALFKERLEELQMHLFGRSTERMECLGQESMFNEAEAKYNEEENEPEIEKAVVVRPKRPRGKLADDLKGLPTRIEMHELSEDELQRIFGEKGWKRLPDEVSWKLDYHPSVKEAVEHHTAVYASKNDDRIVRAPRPADLLAHSIATPSLVAAIMNAKYTNAVPLYRLSQEFGRGGVHLSVPTMANWVIRCAERYLQPVYDKLHGELCRLHVVQADETPCQVSKDGRPANARSYMFVYRSGEMSKETGIVLYDYQKTRNADHLEEFLKQFSGILVSDAYSGYHALDKRREDIRIAHCWAHARRDFADAVKLLKKGGPSKQRMPYCNTVCMNIFLKELSERYSEDIILLCCDGAAWHKSGGLQLPENIILFHIPPYTPEMNPIEQIWKEIRKRGFRNEVFATLEKVVDRLCDTICSLHNNVISSITGRDWIIEVFN